MRSLTFLRIVWFKKDKANTIYNLNFFLKKKFNLNRVFVIVFSYSCTYIDVGSQIAAHTLMETGNGPNEPNTINL